MSPELSDVEKYIIIHRKLQLAQQLYDDPDIRREIVTSVDAGERDIVIARRINPENPRLIANAIAIGRWAEIFPPAPEGRNSQTGREILARWRQEHPEQAAKAAKAASEKGRVVSAQVRRKFTPEVLDQIRQLLNDGFTYAQVCQELEKKGVSLNPGSLCAAAQDYGFRSRTPEIAAQRKAVLESKVRELHAQGLRPKQIVEQLGAENEVLIRDILVDRGLRIRFDWTRSVGDLGTMKELALKLGIDHFDEFNQILADHGLPPVSRNAFKRNFYQR